MPPILLQNDAEQIAAKLKDVVVIPPAVLNKTAEQQRILETRVKTGTLGKMDRKSSRAAVLLELNYRKQPQQENSSNVKRLPWKNLAAAVGVKEASLQQLQQMLSNYIQQQPSFRQGSARLQVVSTAASTSLNQMSRKRPHAAATGTTAASITQRTSRSQVDTDAEMQRRLQELSICVAQYLMDPHGTCRAARKLMNDMLDSIKRHPSVHERRGLLYDLQRYQPAYEAAALYTVYRANATTGRATTKSRRQRDHDENNHDEEEQLDSAEQQRPMDLHDLVDASTNFTYLELKQVLKTVADMAAKIDADRSKLVAEQKAAAGTVLKTGTSKDTSHDTAAISQRLGITFLLGDKSSEDLERQDEEKEAMTVEDDFHVSSVKWQETILSEARERARRSLMEATAASGESTSISDSKALEKAADDVLRKYGLISAT